MIVKVDNKHYSVIKLEQKYSVKFLVVGQGIAAEYCTNMKNVTGKGSRKYTDLVVRIVKQAYEQGLTDKRGEAE